MALTRSAAGYLDVPPRAAIGHGATEATSQNQASVEDDLRRFVAGRLDLYDQQLTWQCEQAIRDYDPCISCATHFLDLTVDRLS